MNTAETSGGKTLTTLQKRLRIRKLESEKNLRAALQDLRESGKIQGYLMGEEGVTWVRYELTLIPDRGEGFSTPKMIVNVRATQGFTKKAYNVGGNATLVNVLAYDFLSVKDWIDILEFQIAVRLKGWHAEARVLGIIKNLAAREDNSIVSGMPTSVHNDRRNGIDLHVIHNANAEGGVGKMPLQCKSGTIGQEAHKELHPDVPSIKVTQDSTDEEIKEKILRIVAAFQKGQILHL